MGGPSGEVGFPPYLEEYHEQLLNDGEASGGTFTSSVQDIADAMLAGANPFSTAAMFNPDAAITTSQDQMDNFTALVDNLDETGLWQEFLQGAIENVEDIVPSTSDVDAEVANFDLQARKELARSWNRFASGMFDINAVINTAFPAGLALIESEYNQNVAKFRTERVLQRNRERTAVIAHSINEMIGLLSLRIQSASGAVQLQETLGRTRIAAKSDQLRGDVAFTVDETWFDMSILERAGGQISAISGIPTMPEKMTKLQAMLAGGFTGAGVGAQIGVWTGSLPLGLLAGVAGALVGAAGGAEGY